MGKLDKRTLLYILSFAATGFLLTVWDVKWGLAPLESASARYNIHRACFDGPFVAPFGWWWPRRLFPEVPVNTALYALLGYALSRALRRLPSAPQDPRGYRVTKALMICFAAVGFVIASWHYLFYFHPLSAGSLTDQIFMDSCISCKLEGYDTGFRNIGVWIALFLFWGPANASFYGMVGWALGRAIRRAPGTHEMAIGTERMQWAGASSALLAGVSWAFFALREKPNLIAWSVLVTCGLTALTLGIHAAWRGSRWWLIPVAAASLLLFGLAGTVFE
jgi:hypothetical protein